MGQIKIGRSYWTTTRLHALLKQSYKKHDVSFCKFLYENYRKSGGKLAYKKAVK